ncbi:MAG: hypothetical protein LBR25_00805 [Erysipelotrichaceae bacterium]|jgi:hypothetical protein|nr:hypothetical protein [Erysipelotrichaceae bacterium]
MNRKILYLAFSLGAVCALVFGFFSFWAGLAVLLGLGASLLSYFLLVYSSGFIIRYQGYKFVFALALVLRYGVLLAPLFLYLFVPEYGILFGVLAGESLLKICIWLDAYRQGKTV